MTRQRYILLIAILGALTAIGPFSIDMYLPGFPSIAKTFHTSTAQVALSLSSFFIGISVGQLLYGPLLDRFGRKNPLYVGLALYIAASIGCFFSASIQMLIILRFIQAVGSCAAAVGSMAIVRDIFPVNQIAKVFALLILILGVSPMIAPTVGGYVSAEFGWRLIFVILAVIATLILLSVIFFLKESYQPDLSYSLKPKPILLSFLSVLKHPQFYTYAICGAIGFSGLFAYLSASPFVFMDVYGISSKVYGWIFALLSIGFIGSSQFNNLLMKKYPSQKIVNVVLACMVFFTLIFVVGSLNNWFNITGTIAIIFLTLCCVGILYPNTTALSLAPFSKNAGTASALLGAFQMAVGSFTSIIVSMFKTRSSLPMACIMFGAALLAFIILLIGKRMITNNTEAAESPQFITH